MNLRFMLTGFFWAMAFIGCTSEKTSLNLEAPMDVVSQQSKLESDNYPYELDVCSADQSLEE